MKGEGGLKHQQKTRKAVRRLKCKVPGCRAKAIQIRDLVKSRMPEIVEPKQLIQSRVLVKRARSFPFTPHTEGDVSVMLCCHDLSLLLLSL